MGGLSRKALQIKNLSGNDAIPALLLDAGNLLFKQQTVAHAQELITASGLMEIYQQMAYEAVAVGPYDLAAGIEFLKIGQAKGFPWLSANLMDKTGNPLFPATKIVQRDGIKIGLIGLTGKVAATSQGIILGDWRKILPGHLKQLSKECQLIVALSSLSGSDNTELARQFPEVHLLITADQQRGSVAPALERDTLITQTMSQGKFLGVLNIDWIPGGSWDKNQVPEQQGSQGKAPQNLINKFNSNFIPLNKNLPEDPQISALVESVKQRIFTHNQKAAAAGKQAPVENDKVDAGFSGIERCQDCHPRQAEFWRSTRHAQAYATLQKQQQNFNLDCLPCHVTGNPNPDKTGSWSLQSLLALPPTLQSVGCETCHGAGQAHADNPDKIKIKKKAEEKTCLACHTKERDAAFDYRQKSPKVTCPAN